MKKLTALTLTFLLATAAGTAAFAAPRGEDAGVVDTHEFGGSLGALRRVVSGAPRVRVDAVTAAKDRWRLGAETFALGFAAARGANGTETFTTRRALEDQLGQVHVRLTQSFAGLPVVGAEIIVHADVATGKVLGVNGRFAVDRNLPRSPRMDAGDALASAMRAYGLSTARIEAVPELTYIVDRQDVVRLAWTTLVAYESENGAEADRLYADAITGEAIARHPQVRRLKNRQIYNCNNQTVWANCTLMFGEGGSSIDNTAMAAYNNGGKAYDYFFNVHGRDGVNGAGGVLRQGVHFGSSFNNAGWTPPGTYTAIAYGDGNNVTFSPIAFSLDVVGHEFTHGVVFNETNLPYTGEQGSIDEGFSDVFGAAVEAYHDGGVNADVWKIADEVYTPGTAGDALRYLNDPAARSQHADYYPGRSFHTDLHRNAGITGLAFYLLTQGGTHPRGATGFSVAGQGITTARSIFYRALAFYVTSSTNFRTLRDGMLQAAADLYGLNSAPHTATWNAWAAVGNNWETRNATLSGGASWVSSQYTTITANWHTAQMTGAAGTNHDVYLEQWNGSTWTVVGSSTGGTSTELLESFNNPGTYRWRVQAAGGAGSYTVHRNRPK